MLRFAGRVAACALLAAVSPAWAQDAYPSRLVKFIVTFPPGGPIDIAARLVADKLQATMKQPIIVENRPGAGGNVAAQAVVSSPPDGYIVLFGIDTTFTVNPAIYPSLPFKPEALKPVMLIGSSGLTVGVQPVARGELARRLHRLREGQGRDDHVQLRRQRQPRPSRFVDSRGQGRRESHARSVQGQHAGGPGGRRRRGSGRHPRDAGVVPHVASEECTRWR